MRLLITRLFAIGLFGLPMIAVADPIVTYTISNHSGGGASASWAHSADGCESDGLYMCNSSDGFRDRVTGSIIGTLSGGGVLTITDGSLSWGGDSYDVLSGSLGGSDPWTLTIANFGTFLFEANLGFGTNGPNQFDGESFFLWGQNSAAYGDCSSFDYAEDCDSYRLGFDLYGEGEITVPEPATLALLSLGLLGMGLARRRKTPNPVTVTG